MKLRSIETTPSPNCIKLNLDEPLGAKPLTVSDTTDISSAPKIAQQLFSIEGVREVFLVDNFITLTRKSHAEWQAILAEAARLIDLSQAGDLNLTSFQGTSSQSSSKSSASNNQSQNLGQVEVTIQAFRGIPVQVKATATDGEQTRVSLPDRFNQALQRVINATGANYIGERRWQPYQSQFGNPDEVAQMVAEEIASLIDENELARIEAAAIKSGEIATIERPSQQALLAELSHPDWKYRLKALQQIEVNSETFSAAIALLEDEHSTIRRWAAAILGGSGMKQAVNPLCRVVVSDRSAIVRRTAGDALSDLGDEGAIATMCQALTDSSPLVRWRAARFLNEIGDSSAVEFLRQAAVGETEFDVRIEMLAALERIEGGRQTQLPMWMRIAGGDK
ncbi:MAG: virulence factor [Chroococcidiopsis sp.]